jgi:hypothetical protein
VKSAYRIALICGAVPLLLGSLLFLLWIATTWDGLMTAGIFTIYGGLGLFFIGLVALTRYAWLALRAGELPRRKIAGSVATALLLLLANFPVAWGIVGAVVAIDTRYTIRVRNDSDQPLNHVRLFGGGATVAIFSIPAHSSTERSLWFQNEGELRFEATRESAQLTGKITVKRSPAVR